MLTFGERLRMARERAGLTQLEVYKAINLNNKSLSRYENNATSPDPDTMRALIELYDVSADFILGFSDKMEHARPNISKGKPKTDNSALPDDTLDKLKHLSPEAKKKAAEYIGMLRIIDELKASDSIIILDKNPKT